MPVTNSVMIDLIEGAAKIRKDPKIPRDFISEALDQVNSGKEGVERYLSGAPTLKGVYVVASQLYAESLQSA